MFAPLKMVMFWLDVIMTVEPVIVPAKAMEPPVDSSIKVPRLALEDTCPVSSMDMAVMVQAE
jgi:hypothetical protein